MSIDWLVRFRLVQLVFNNNRCVNPNRETLCSRTGYWSEEDTKEKGEKNRLVEKDEFVETRVIQIRT
jgi:hypothetical protein